MSKKTILVICMSLVMVLTLSFGAVISSAESLNQSKQQVQQDINQKKQEIKQGKEKEKQVSQKIDSIVDDINDKQEEINVLQSKLNETQNSIDKVNAELKKLKKDIKKQEKGLNGRLRSMYMNDSTSFIDVILNSGSISELLTNVELIKRIHKSDKDILAKLEKNHKKVDKKKKELVKLQDSYKAQKAELDEQNSQLQAQKGELSKQRSKIQSSNKKKEDELDDLEAAAAEIDAKIEAARRAAESKSGGGSSGGKYDNKGGGSSASGYAWPVSGPVTSGYGYRWGGAFHGGVDIGVPTGTPVRASKAGTVIIAESHWSYGNYVAIAHSGGYSTLYAHNSRFACHVGQHVSQGTVIAYAGSTGNSTGPHCHFEVHLNGVRQNPMNYLP